MVNYLWENLFRHRSEADEILAALKRVPLFDTLSDKELRFVSAMLHTRKFKPTEPVFRQGEVGIGMYIIMTGAVEIFVEDKTLVTRLGPGDFFGELSLVEDNGRRTATALAVNDCTTLGFFKPDLLEIVETNPSTAIKIFQRLGEVLGKRLKETTAKLTELKREPVGR